MRLKQLLRRASSGTTRRKVDGEGLSSDHEICDGEEQWWDLDVHVTCQGDYINAFQLVQLSYSGFRVDGTIPKRWFIWTPI